MIDDIAHLQSMVEKYQQEYDQQVAQLAQTRQSFQEISCTATAPRKAVSVTATFGGKITAISFPTGAYKRMAPAELTTAVLNTVQEAQRLAEEAAAKAMAPSLPEGVDAASLLRGEADLQELLTMHTASRPDFMEDLTDLSTIEHLDERKA